MCLAVAFALFLYYHIANVAAEDNSFVTLFNVEVGFGFRIHTT